MFMVIDLAREARHLQKTTVFSIKQNTDSKLFRNKDDRKEFVSIVKRNKEKFDYDIYGYCLLDDDEFWLILNTKGRSISSIMKGITISYALYRDDIPNLFTERYKSEPIYSVQRLEAVLNELKSDKRYESCHYCFYHPTLNRPLSFISNVHKNVEIKQVHPTNLTDAEAKELLDQFVGELNLNLEERNKMIRSIYSKYNVTQKQLGDYFNLSNSTISKILSA